MQSTTPRGGHLPEEAGELGQRPLMYNLPPPQAINWNRWADYWEDRREEICRRVYSPWEVLPTALPYPASFKIPSVLSCHRCPGAVSSFVMIIALVQLPSVPTACSFPLQSTEDSSGSVEEGTPLLTRLPWLPTVCTPPYPGMKGSQYLPSAGHSALGFLFANNRKWPWLT